MNEKLKIQKLWCYLKIQDEILVIQAYSRAKGKDEYLVATMGENGLAIRRANSLSEIPKDKPFRMIQQIGENGKHEIPSVNEIISDNLNDY